MTPQEFKAWFEGFTEAFTGVPTKAQWARVKERVGEIDGKPVTERVFVDRYWPTYYPPQPRWYGYNCTTTLTSAAVNSMNSGDNHSVAFNSATAMADLGRADALAIAS